jgi:hypothetical protein
MSVACLNHPARPWISTDFGVDGWAAEFGEALRRNRRGRGCALALPFLPVGGSLLFRTT